MKEEKEGANYRPPTENACPTSSRGGAPEWQQCRTGIVAKGHYSLVHEFSLLALKMREEQLRIVRLIVQPVP